MKALSLILALLMLATPSHARTEWTCKTEGETCKKHLPTCYENPYQAGCNWEMTELNLSPLPPPVLEICISPNDAGVTFCRVGAWLCAYHGNMLFACAIVR